MNDISTPDKNVTAVPDQRPNRRRRLLTLLALAVAVGLVLFGLYWVLYARFFVSTNDAYVGGDLVAITSRESGTVLALHVDNTQAVARGQLLVELDPLNANIALQAAEAELARAVRSVRTNFSRVDQAGAQLTAARIALDQARSDYRRRAQAGQAVSHEELAHARDAVAAAQAQIAADEGGLAQASATVQGTKIANNPDVLAAMARLRQASIALAHMRIFAPVGGVVAQRTVQLGQQIAAGTPLMAVVPLDNIWIDANFKEGQLEAMRVGQPVRVVADIYGSGVTYHGKIVGLGAGSGSAFALLPPQNASGNWIKIVQRVPVRIALDAAALKDHPLRVGLSVSARVDVHDTSGPLVSGALMRAAMRSDIGDDGSAEADRLIARILAENSGP
jgi:membrane fusion protein (multidrug efflux system)